MADLVWMLASVAGVTALLVASEPAFAALRIAGAVYLTWLGLRLLLGLLSLLAYAAAFAQVRRATAHVRVQRLLLRCAGLALIAVGQGLETLRPHAPSASR